MPPQTRAIFSNQHDVDKMGRSHSTAKPSSRHGLEDADPIQDPDIIRRPKIRGLLERRAQNVAAKAEVA